MREVTNLHLSELYRIWTEMGYETAELNQRMVRCTKYLIEYGHRILTSLYSCHFPMK